MAKVWETFSVDEAWSFKGAAKALLVDHAVACQQQQQAPLRLLKRASLQVFNALCVGDGASSLLSRHTIGFGTTEWLIPFILLQT